MGKYMHRSQKILNSFSKAPSQRQTLQRKQLLDVKAISLFQLTLDFKWDSGESCLRSLEAVKIITSERDNLSWFETWCSFNLLWYIDAVETHRKTFPHTYAVCSVNTSKKYIFPLSYMHYMISQSLSSRGWARFQPNMYHSMKTRHNPITTPKMIVSLLFRKLILFTRLLIIGNLFVKSFSLVWTAWKGKGWKD